MNILRMIRARAPETLRDEMRRMAYEPWAGYSKRRNAHALKWYNRLAGGKK